MARNLFGPMGVFSTPADRLAQQPATGAPTPAGQPVKPDVGSIAQKYRLPRNILQVYEERGEDPEEAARKITADLDAGRAFEDIVPKAVRIRASDIADEIRGTAPRQGSIIADFSKQFGGSVVRGLGGAVENVGIMADEALTGGADPNDPGLIKQGTRWLGDAIRDAGKNLQSGVSPAARKALQESTPDGDLFAPSTWTFGKNPSVTGYAMLSADVFGSLLPVVATAVITKSPTASMAVGGMMGGGAAAETGRDIVMQAYRETTPDGRNSLEASSPYYRELIAAGVAPDDAAQRTAEAAGRMSSLFTTPISALGGAATGRLLTKPVKALASRGVAARVGGTAGLGALEEGVQEAAETVATRAGTNEATGMDLGLTEGTFGDFVLGAIGGTAYGAGAAGLRELQNRNQPAPPAPAAPPPSSPLALPSPTSGGTIFGQPPANMNPGADGSGVGQGAAPGMAPPGASGAAPVEPMGVLGRAAQAAPDLTPQPQAAPLFPDMKPGAKVVLADPATGELIDATFQREENGIPIVRINGVEQPIPPQMFDMAVNAGQKAVEAAKGAKGGLAKAATPKAPRQPAPEPDLNALSLEEAQTRLADLEEKIRIAAKPSKKMIETRARLIDVVDRKKGEANAAIQPDGGAGVEPVAPVQGGDAAGSGPNPVASVQEPPVSPAPVASGAEGVAGAAAEPQQGEALTQGAPSRVVGENPVERAQRDIEQKRARLAEIEAGLTEEQRAAVKRVVDQAPEPDRWAARRGALSAFAGEAEQLLQPTSKDDTRAFRAAQKAAQQATAPRAPVAPITTPPSERIQPDMLGGQTVTEEDMAAKERRKREWGKFLAIAEGGKYDEDMELEGRDVLIRPGRVVIRAKKGAKSDLDYRLDTAGMGRDDISAAVRGALRELDRVSPLPAPELKPAAPAPVPQQEAYVATPKNFPFADSMAGNPGPQAKRWLAAASDETILATPDMGLSENWLRAERQRRKIGEWAEKQPKPRDFAEDVKAQENFKKGMRVEYTAKGPFKKADGTVVEEEVRYGTITGIDRKSGQGTVEVLVDGGVNGKGYDVSIGASRLRPASETPSAAKIEAAAAETDPNPTPAQAEAENYRTGKVDWNGLTLSIENAKGSTRRKVGPDGETAWEVVMPAHYGRILRTEGADGDHLDFFMGPNPESDAVFVIDQVDADTGRFDEHKIMLGFVAREDAQAAYYEAFSDGRGEDRMGDITPMTVNQLKNALQNSDWGIPTSIHRMNLDKGPVYASGFYDRFRGKLREAPSYLKNNRAQRTWTEGWTEANKHPMAPELPGSRGTPGQLQVKNLRTGQTRTVESPVPVADDRREARKRQVRAQGKQAAIDNAPRTAPDWMQGDNELVDLWMAGYGDGIAERGQSPAPEADAKGRRKIGTNVRGEDLFEDERGVRSFIDKDEGVRSTEPVRMLPGGGVSIDKDRRNRDFSTQEEWDAKYPSEQKNDAPLSKADAIKDEAEKIGAYLTQQMEREKVKARDARAKGDGSKAGIHDANLRRLRMNTFKAEEAITEALEKGIFDPFKAHEADFPLAASELRSAIGRVQPMVDAAPAPKAGATSAPEKPAEQPAKPAAGILSVLSEDKQKRADELKAKLAAKARNQVSSGVDPEYLTLGGELVALYVEAGVKKFGQMLRDFAESTGLTMRQAQAPMRVAYNHVRDTMDLDGEDVSDFDTADQVMAEIRKAIAEEAATGEVPASQEAPQDGNVEAPANTENTDAGPAIRRDDQEPLEGTPSEAVPPTEGGRQAGSRGAGAEQEGGRTGRKPSRAESGDAAPRGGRVRSGRNLSGTGRVNRGKRGAAATDVADDTAELQIVKDAKVSVPAVNFTITDEVRLGLGSEGQKYADNIAAIRLVKQLEAENRRATPEEQKVLARYVGWGGMKNAFRVAGSGENGGIAKGYEKKVAELEELLDPAELKAARNSTKAAHYTSQSVVEAIWKAVQRLGFNGGTVLEPSVGVGNFLGLMPQELRGKSRVMGVEYDSLTARIAKHLYPASDIMHTGFEKVPLPREQFALAIGNPPFGRDELYFQHVPEANGRTIHNQFFVASLHALAPEGILGMVVTHNLMDSLSSANRVAMARYADLVGAIRLPSNAFQENARTEVVTDILFFRKHPADMHPRVPQFAADLAVARETEPGASLTNLSPKKLEEANIGRAELEQIDALAKSFSRWVPSNTITDPAGSGAEINVNRYFQRNRSMIIGDLNATGTMHGRGNGLNVTMQDATQFDALLDQAIERLPASDPVDSVAERSRKNYDAMVEAIRLSIRRAEPGEVRIDPDSSLRMVVDVDSDRADSMLAEITLTEETPFSGGYTYNADGKWQIERDVLDEKGNPVKVRKADGTLSSRNVKAIEVVEDLSTISGRSKWGKKRLQLLRDMLPIRDAMKRQLVLEAEGATDTQIADNRKALNDAYDAFISKHGSFDPQATAIANMMPDGALILETQLVNKETGAVSKSPIMSERVIEPPQAIDTAANIDDAIAISLSEYGGVDLDRMAALLKTDVADIARQLETSDPPKAFFDPETQSWDTPDGYLSGMVRKKLHAAQAAGLERNVKALEAVLPPKWDSTQVTPTVGSNWIPTRVYGDFLKELGYNRAVVMYSELTNTYSVTADGEEAMRWRSDDAMSAVKILERLLNAKPIKVTYTDGDGKTHVDEVATEASKQKATEITAEFLDWVYQDDARRELLVDIFNEKFNTRVLRQRDGSHLKLPGKNPAIKMRRHQMNAIWRGITDRTVLLDHVVGAGKTFTAIARIMERRRMGLSRKPMVVVPNHLIEQWRDDTLRLYPGAKVLAAGAKDFDRKNRRRLFARIAASDSDLVIIGHSSFGFIDIDPATEQRFLEDELRRAQEAVTEAQEEAAEQGFDQGFRKPMNVAEAERLVTKIEERLNKVRAGRRDRLLTFEQMGVDDLTIDEAHEFKNLAYSSRMTNTSGMGNKAGSAKAMDLHLKLRSLHERQGTSIAFLTGTPISNSVAEMYLLLRNLAPKELAELGLENFDAWRALFVSASAAFEPTEAGGVKEVTRLGREWTNMRSLMELYYSIADAVSLDDIKAAFAEDNAGAPFPVPPVKSQKAGEGDRQMIAVKPDQQQRAILREIVRGFESLPGITDPMERGAERLRLMDRARKVSLDARAVDPNIYVPPGTGKIGAVVDNVKRIYDASSADKGTQIIFLDRSVPKSKGDEEYVAKFDEWMQKLTEARNEGDEKAEQKAVEELEKYDLQDVEARRAAVRGGWNAYDEIKRQLVAKGLPEEEIRFVQEASNDEEKKALFAAVRRGDVRVLIGSTPRMGAGTNVQDLLVALHHADVTWKPSDIEQREGRIVRQGNKLLEKYGHDKFEVEVIAYATEMTVDAKMWSLNATKLKAINGVRKYDGSFFMEFDDEESASMAEMAALATGNPLMVERVTLEADRQRMDLQRRSFNQRQSGFRSRLSDARRTIANTDGEVAQLESYVAALEPALEAVKKRAAKRSIKIAGKEYKDPEAALLAAQEEIERQRDGKENARYKIDIDGNTVTTMDLINGSIKRAFGTPDFEAEVNGRPIIDIWDASQSISSAIGTAVAKDRQAESHFIDGITFMGMPVEIDVYQGQFDRGESRTVDINMVHEGQTVTFHQLRSDKAAISANALRPALESLAQRLRPEVFGNLIRHKKARKAQAEADLPMLEEEVGKAWPRQEEYDTKSARLREVIEILSTASDTARLGDDTETDTGVSMEMRADREPVATLTGDELGEWEDIRQLGKKAEAWYRENLVGTTVIMESTGWPIQFGRVGSKKLGGRKGDVLLRIVPALRDIIKSADVVSSERGAKAGAERQTFHKLSATVSLGGDQYPVVVTIREDGNGKFHYDLSMNNTVSSGAANRVTEARSGQPDDDGDGGRNDSEARQSEAQLRDPALEGAPADLNLEFAPPSRKTDPEVQEDDLRALTKALNGMPEMRGLEGRVTVKAVRRLVSHVTGNDILGRFTARDGIEVRAGRGAIGVMRHEIIHALRSEKLWNAPYGLFSGPEWRELVRAARAEPAIVRSVMARYKDQPPALQAEEMVAELYRLWAAQRDQYGAVARSLLKIEGFLRALANALRGRGFVDAGRTMDRIASGRIGGRGPDRPGGGRRGSRGRDREMRVYHGSPHIFDKFSLDKIGTGEGAQAFGWGLYFAGRKEVAEWYRSKLSKNYRWTKNGQPTAYGDFVTDLDNAVRMAAVDKGFAPDHLRQIVRQVVSLMDEGRGRTAAYIRREYSAPRGFDALWNAALDAAEPYRVTKKPGRLFEVEIPDESDLLDWDAPLSRQPEKVRKIIDRRLRKRLERGLADLRKDMPGYPADVDDLTGAQAYDALANAEKMGNPNGYAVRDLRYFHQAASERLRAAGIPGHRYLDGGSRADGDGTRNYVIYDDAAIDVVGMEMRALPGTVRDKFAPLVGFRNWRNPSEWISNFLTDRMVSENASILAVVPGRPLFSELGRSLLSAKAYLRTKEDMDALRNDWHAKTADVADEWTRMQSKDPRANEAMMDLMHRSTMTGVDPSKPDDWGKNDNLLRSAKIEVSRLGDRAPDWAKQKVSDEMKRRRTYATVKQMYDALPPEYRAFYVKVKNTYEALANDWDKALEENLKNAARIAMKNAERAHRQALRKIKDDGLTGAERDEAVAKADEDLKKAKARAQASSEGQIKSLRKIFEGQRLKGPYFPLARFGKYFVTVRNDKGEVVSFSRMETEGRQRTHIAEMKEKYPTGKVTFGTIDAKTNMRDQVDPKFVAEVEAIVADSGADADVLDAIWQRYLETLPDESIRTSKIHRKGREGFSRDALRAFAHHMFHGAHQLARLKYGLSLQEHVDDAREEARRSSNPNRMGALVDEMQRRMEWTMNPQGAAWVAAASSLSFVWYLGVSPAAALVNLSQTTIIGPAMMKARFQKVSTGKILSELARAAKDFGKGQGNVWTDTWSAENAETLTTEEKAAMAEGYRRGAIDKTQAYDLASVAESGVEYNPFREKWMRRIGWAFHHAERVNREVTYLANYRLARADGLSHADAMDAASDLTWQIHFSYQNSDRARIMQRDWPKFFLQFRQFSVNMLYRLFRDAHQSLNGATAAERREARTHLIGISLSMMAHAGIKGVWGYGLIMGLLALFFPGDSDDLEDWMQDALLMEGDNPGVAAWNFAMGAALNGIPGQVTGSSLVERIGMPNLWFREPNRDLEGTDLLQHYVNETLGPTVGIMFSLARGAQYVTDGEVVRGVEAMTPKFVRDVIKSGRFAVEGVQTMNDDAILESVNPWELLLQANGFTPARVAERYDMNNRLKNREKAILDERKSLHRAAGDAIKAGGPIPEKVLEQIRDFNARFPEYPITGDTIRQSFQGRMRASERNEFGVSLNPKLNDRLREALPAPLYN